MRPQFRTIARMSRTSETQPPQDQMPGWFSLPPMRYPNEYAWFLLVSSMDIMLTWVILNRGGREVNPVADLVITHWGLPGAVGFKFALTLFVIILCEVIGRKQDQLARRLAYTAVIISALPVVYSLSLLSWFVFFP